MKKLNVILFIILIISMLSCGSGIVFASNNLPYSNLNFVKYEGNIPHFFTHEIINNPSKAFDYSNSLSKHFDKDCITYSEFYNFLNIMYENGYALIDIYDVVGFENNNIYFKDVYVPYNKKPFLLSFDDMSFDSTGTGMSDKIILDENGKIATYTFGNNPEIEYNKESLPILECFIEEHPDFSINNARAVICSTGYNGLLGYRINKFAKNREKEIEDIKPLISKLKQLNYKFGCHTYNHINVKCIGADSLYKDLSKYKNEIIPIIGETDIFCFPCGERTKEPYKLSILKQFGFNIFFCVGLVPENQIVSNTVYLDRKVLDGHSLRNFNNIYKEYFNTFLIYDNENRKIKI